MKREGKIHFDAKVRHYHRPDHGLRTWEEWIDPAKAHKRATHGKIRRNWLPIVMGVIGLGVTIAILVALFIEMR